MDRRQFITSSSMILGITGISGASWAKIEAPNQASGETRLTKEYLSSLGISPQITHIIAPGGQSVAVPLQARIIRQFDGYIYTWSETERLIRVYDETGNASLHINLPGQFGALKDFTLDSNGNIYAISSGQNYVTWLDNQGYVLGTIGAAGIDLPEQLNGPVSLTMDSFENLHVLNAGTKTIKVFSTSGAYLYEYGQSRWLKARSIQSIDGTEKIIVKGGLHQDNIWQFSPAGKLLSSQ